MTLHPEQVAEALPSYDIGGELGRGGSAIVFSGWHRSLGRSVAIKQLPLTFSKVLLSEPASPPKLECLLLLITPMWSPFMTMLSMRVFVSLSWNSCPGGLFRSA